MKWRWNPNPLWLILFFVVFAAAAFLFDRYRKGLTLLTGEEPAVVRLKNRNRHLRFDRYASDLYYGVRDSSTGVTAYVCMLYGHHPEGDLKVFRCGSRTNEILPAWLPLFPKAQDPVCLEATESPAGTGYVSFGIEGAPDKLLEFYEAALAKLEWDGGGSGRSSRFLWSLSKSHADTGRKVEIWVHQYGSEQRVVVSFAGR